MSRPAPAPPGGRDVPDFFRLDALDLGASWFILARSRQVTRRPSAWMLLNQPVLLYRDQEGRVRAMLDRCPHRGVRLSLGEVVGSNIVCRYHGWSFRPDGRCESIPSNGPDGPKSGCDVPPFEAFESRGFVWVRSRPSGAGGEHAPAQPPQAYFTDLDDPRKGRIIYGGVSLKAFFISALENFWDVTHTRFVHEGLMRTEAMKKVVAEVTASPGGSQVAYEGEPFPKGAIFSLLRLFGCSAMAHRDFFLRPGYVESLYEFDKGYYIRVQDFVTPNTDTECTYFSITTFNLPMPHWLFSALGTMFAAKIVGQDRAILESQQRSALQAGGSHITFARSDFYLRELLRVLKRAPPRTDAAGADRPVKPARITLHI